MSMYCSNCDKVVQPFWTYNMQKKEKNEIKKKISGRGDIPLHNPPPFEPYLCPKCKNSITYMKSYLANLFPPYVITKIVNYINDIEDIKSCAFLCRKWRTILLSSIPNLWSLNKSGQVLNLSNEKENNEKNTTTSTKTPPVMTVPYEPTKTNQKGKKTGKDKKRPKDKKGTIGIGKRGKDQ